MSSVAGDTQGGSDGRSHGTSQGRVEGQRFSAVTALVVSGLVALGLLTGTVLLLRVIGSDSPEASLSLVFVCAAVVLILVVCTLAIVLRRLGLTDRTEAMGLPSGTIRAVISLLLIMLFFIAAIFLFNSTQAKTDVSETRSLQGISAEMFFGIPVDQIQGSVLNESEGNVSYDVVLYQPPSGTATSDDLAKQLITTVGTLVTAVAAFYFGANSVKSARSDGGVSAKDDDTPDVQRAQSLWTRFKSWCKDRAEQRRKDVKHPDVQRAQSLWTRFKSWCKAQAEQRRTDVKQGKQGDDQENSTKPTV